MVNEHLASELIDEITEEANRRYRQWNKQGVRGQVVMPQDGYDYWVMVVTFEKAICNVEI